MFAENFKNSLCRTCSINIKKKEIFNIFDIEDLAKKIMLCSALPVEVSDEYPINVCLDCYKQILKFYEFQQMCSKSQEKFNELLRASQVGDNRSCYRLNNESEHKTVEVCNNMDTVNVIEVYIEKKKRGRPPKRKQEDYKNQISLMYETLDQCDLEVTKDASAENLQSPLVCENSYDSKSNDGSGSSIILSNETVDLKSCEIKRTKCVLDVEEPQLKNHYEIGEKTLSETDSKSSSQELKSVKQCDRCDQCFNAAEHLEAHKRQHDGTPPFTCTYEGCSRSFNRWYFFNKHQKHHNTKQEQIHKCDIDNCERVYKNKCALNIHKRKCHNYGPELKKHMCEICGKVFKSATVLSDHRYTHIDRTQLPYVCEEEDCSKRFSTKEKLRVHKMRHAGIKNFICPYCGMRKTTRNELKIHINYHTLERTWPCRFCPKVCNSAGNLKMHVKNIHERAKDFACRFCERTFAKADTKKYHEMTHTGEKPHECEQCGRRFVQPAALRTHKKIHLRQKKNVIKDQKVDEIEMKDQTQNTIEVVETTVITEAMVAEILSDNNTNLE